MLAITSPTFSKVALSNRPKRSINTQKFPKRCVCAASNGGGKEKRPSNDALLGGIITALAAEPVSFLGGIVAGFLALDVKQDPLKTWIDTRAAEAGLAYQAAKERLEEQQRKTST